MTELSLKYYAQVVNQYRICKENNFVMLKITIYKYKSNTYYSTFSCLLKIKRFIFLELLRNIKLDSIYQLILIQLT